MTNKQLEQQLADAARSLKTDLSFERIAQAVSAAPSTPIVLPCRRRWSYAAVAAAVCMVAACAVAVLGIGGVWHHRNTPSDPPAVTSPIVEMADTVIDIDVNPSVEIAVDGTDRISAAVAVNRDAQEVLADLDLTQMPLADGVETLFDALVTHGYVSDGNNPVLVTVKSGDTAEADRLHALVNNGVDTAMAQHHLTASVVNQTVTAFDEVTEFAQTYGISNGKAAFILKLAEQDPRLDAEALADHAFAVLAAMAQYYNVPLGELVDYNATDGLWQDILNALSAEVTEAEHRWGSMLSVSEVKALALDALPSDHIAENALVVRIDFSWEEEEPYYRIELVSLGYLYEYTIHAGDGTFLNSKDSTTNNDNGTVHSTLAGGGTRVPVELPDEKDPDTSTTLSPSTTTTTAPTTRPTISDGTLTEARAKEIVFFRLGITEAEVKDVSVGRHPTKNEMSVWLIYDNIIYCVYLNSATGAVTKTVYLPLDIAVSNYRLDEWDAMQIALEDARVTEEECGEISIVYYVNNDAPFIFVGWTVDNVVYEYRIDGVDGDIALNTAPPAMVIP